MEQHVRYVRSADGTNIAYSDMGEGTPLVLSSNIWTHLDLTWNGLPRKAVLQLLNDGFRLIRYDMRGMGMSDRHVEDFSIDSQVADIEAVRARIGVGRFALYGIVHATPACIAYAARHPERVTHLILTVPFTNGEDWYQATPTLKGLESFRDLGAEQWELYTLTHATALTKLTGEGDVATLAQLMRASTTPETLRRYFAALRTQDVTDLLGDVRAPTMIVDTTNNHASTFVRAVASGISAARLASVESIPGSPALAEAMHVTRFVLGRESQPATLDSDTAPAGTPGATATVLFTDIESSTQTTQRLGDAAAQDLVRAHNTIVREALTAHGGREIKHTGDGIMASFGSASGAVSCAIAIQRAVSERRDLPRVRIGLNAGEPIAEDGDLFGTTVQLARRICDQGQPSDVLVSDVVRQLVAGKGFLFADAGVAALKGFDEPVHLYALRWQGEA